MDNVKPITDEQIAQLEKDIPTAMMPVFAPFIARIRAMVGAKLTTDVHKAASEWAHKTILETPGTGLDTAFLAGAKWTATNGNCHYADDCKEGFNESVSGLLAAIDVCHKRTYPPPEFISREEWQSIRSARRAFDSPPKEAS